jgi:glutamate-ammonia-ligase adenylyltransferase
MVDQVTLTRLFRDPVPASRHFASLTEAFLTSGAHYPVDGYRDAVLRQLEHSPDPDMALTNLVRFTDATVSKVSLFNDLVHYPVVTELLLRLFGASQYFADILVRDPGLFRWLTASDVLTRPLTEAYLGAEVRRVEEMFSAPSRRIDALKRIHRREMLRVGAMDLLANAGLEQTTRQLSLIADAMVGAAYRVALEQLTLKHGCAPPTPFAVIGLGKVGGEELNYSSDIDVLFVYGSDGGLKTNAGTEVTHEEFFVQLAERLVQLLSQSTHEGYFYRVDTRLRPELGPLARSQQRFLLYYESRGEIWERQMLIKARPMAGDCAFGASFLRRLEPFVYPRTFFHHPAESAARIKARIEKKIGEEMNVKLMSGGIRDIEFIVQTLQLINGGKRTGVREANTLRAIPLLQAEQLLSESEARTLGSAYEFLRTAEHRLQMKFNTQTHTLPDDDRGRRSLAAQVGLRSGADLLTEVHRVTHAVRAIFDRVLAPPLEEGGLLAIIDGGATEDGIKSALTRYGFRDVRRALRNVRLMSSGSALTGARELDNRGRSAFLAVAPALFEGIARTPDPDMTLHNAAVLASASKFPGQMYTLLQEVNFRRLFTDICGASPRLVRGLAARPLLLERLALNAAALESGDRVFERGGGDVVALKNEGELIAGLRHVLGLSSFEEMCRELASLADAVVLRIFMEESKRLLGSQPHLALFALGKYGSREMNFDADLDMIFVGNAAEPRDATPLEKLASAMVRRLTTVSEAGTLYEVDARLRPEGRNAPLVADLRSYGKYLEQRASLWERQSLTRLRWITGDAALGAKVEEMVASAVFEAPLPAGWVLSAVAMRRKMETRSRVRGQGPLDTKLGPGGMVDIEFLAQMIQLRDGGHRRDLRALTTAEVLTAVEGSTLSREESEELRSAYALYGAVQKTLRLALEERGSLLPEGERLDLLARLLKEADGESLKEKVEETMSRVRRLFLKVTGRLSEGGGAQ